MSHIEQIYANPYFKPFEGEEADEVFKKVKSKVNTELITDEQIQRAIESLSMLSNIEIEKAIGIQDEFCIECGKCCRDSHPIDIIKEEFKLIADRLSISYKKLKRKLRAYHSGRAQIWHVPGKPCPFLEGKNFCTIYDVRPLVCRLYPLGKTFSGILMGKPMQLINPKDCAVIGEIYVIIAIVRLLDERISDSSRQRA